MKARPGRKFVTLIFLLAVCISIDAQKTIVLASTLIDGKVIESEK